MSTLYSNDFKKKLCEEIYLHQKSTIKTAEKYGVPLKTLEKWITAYNKKPTCFDSSKLSNNFHIINPPKLNDYDDMSIEDFKRELMKKDIEIARLKKAYLVKGGGTAKKVFVTFSKKNTK